VVVVLRYLVAVRQVDTPSSKGAATLLAWLSMYVTSSVESARILVLCRAKCGLWGLSG